MKKVFIFILVFSLFVFCGPLLAEDTVEGQEGREERDFREKIPEEAMEVFREDLRQVKIKGNGGPLVGFLDLDLAGLNDILTAVDYNGSSFSAMDGPMVLFGGGGLAGFPGGMRFGGMRMEGRLSSSSEDMEAILNVNYGGFLLERGIYVAEKMDISAGALMGSGKAQLELFYRSSGSFEGVVEEPHSSRLQRDFVFIEPRVNLHQKLSTFIGFDLSVGYIVGHDFGGGWEMSERSVSGGPLQSFQSPSLNLRLSFGF